MTFEDRVRAVAEFGLPERQARFLVTVMLHAGVCVPRQFARFAGTAYGHTVNEFFDKIALRGYASEWPCQHPRARLYHVHKLRLYRAIGQPHSRYRRPVSVRQVIERLMWLDEVIDNRDLTWLATVDDKAHFFRRTLPGLAPELLPHTTTKGGPSRMARLFPDDAPIGVQTDGRVVFPYLVTTAFAKDPFCEFLQRHIHLLHALEMWTVRVLAPHWFMSCAQLEAAARFELTMPLAAQTLVDMDWYFKQRKETSDLRARCQSDGEFWEETHRFSRPTSRRLYQRFLQEGKLVFELLASPAIRDALARGTGRIESRVLPRSYDHLAPRIESESLSSRVEAPDEGLAQPQPPAVAGPSAAPAVDFVPPAR
jgi:hypothetical protein